MVTLVQADTLTAHLPFSSVCVQQLNKNVPQLSPIFAFQKTFLVTVFLDVFFLCAIILFSASLGDHEAPKFTTSDKVTIANYLK